MIRCYVVDNEEHAIGLLADYIQKTEGLELVGTELDPTVANKKIINNEVVADLTFLDIEMPQLSGIDLAAQIQSHTHIVFTTAHEHFALKAFDTDVIDYILKPITYLRFLNAIRKVQKKISLMETGSITPHIFIQSQEKGKLVNINLSEIIYIENAENYVRIILEDKEYLTYLTMKEMEKILPHDTFLRLHRAYIINTKKIDFVKAGVVHMKNEFPVNIGDTYRDAFQRYMNGKVIRSTR